MKESLKGIYNSIPFKKQMFTVLKSMYTPGESIYRHLHFNGVIEVCVDKNSKFKMNHMGFQIENEIFWKGLEGWEKNSVSLWVKLSRNAKTVFDIGANTGIFALITKSVQPSARVYAFEPIKRIYKLLDKNIDLNNFDIQSFPLAISNSTGKAFVYDNPELVNDYSYTVNSYINASDIIGKVKTEIEIITLDEFIDEHNITSIDLMKIDVETHEGEVLEGFMKHLPLFKPTFLIEILRDESGKKVQHCLDGLGYLFFNIDEDGGIIQVDEIIRRGHNFNYLLCSPEVAKQLEIDIK